MRMNSSNSLGNLQLRNGFLTQKISIWYYLYFDGCVNNSLFPYDTVYKIAVCFYIVWMFIYKNNTCCINAHAKNIYNAYHYGRHNR